MEGTLDDATQEGALARHMLAEQRKEQKAIRDPATQSILTILKAGEKLELMLYY